MDKTNNLQYFLTDIADAIREKKGTTDLINAQEFSDEIKSIETKPLGESDVNFYDYDGTLLYSYSWEEAKNLTELPQYPARDGVNFIEWNYTLEDIKKQGTKFFFDENGLASYVTDLTINGITYQAYNIFGCFEHYDVGEQYWALLTIGDPKEGDAYYYAESSDKGVTWTIEPETAGSIINAGETIGKADVGAITDRSYQVTDDSDPICEKCVVIPTELDTNSQEDFYVTNRAPHSILCLANRHDPYVCYIELNTDRLVVPKDFIFGQNYESIQNSTIEDLYINGGNTGGYTIYVNNIIRKVHVGPYINMDGAFNSGLPVGVLKLSPITSTLVNVNAIVIDCSDCITVPILDGVNTESLVSVIIPTSLEADFASTTGWSELTSKFIINNTK